MTCTRLWHPFACTTPRCVAESAAVFDAIGPSDDFVRAARRRARGVNFSGRSVVVAGDRGSGVRATVLVAPRAVVGGAALDLPHRDRSPCATANCATPLADRGPVSASFGGAG